MVAPRLWLLAATLVLCASGQALAKATKSGALGGGDMTESALDTSVPARRRRFVRGIDAETAEALYGRAHEAVDHTFRQKASVTAEAGVQAAAGGKATAEACLKAGNKLAGLLFIRNIPIMLGGVGTGFLIGMFLWFTTSPATFTLFLATRVGIDPSTVSGTLGSPPGDAQ